MPVHYAKIRGRDQFCDARFGKSQTSVWIL